MHIEIMRARRKACLGTKAQSPQRKCFTSWTRYQNRWEL